MATQQNRILQKKDVFNWRGLKNEKIEGVKSKYLTILGFKIQLSYTP